MGERFSTSNVAVSYIAESTEGTTPAEPAFKRLRITGETLDVQRTAIQSKEMDPSRNIKDLILAGGRAAGGIEGEFSDAALDDILETVMWSTWSSDAITNGVAFNPKSFEAVFNGTSGDIYKRFTGCYIPTFSLEAKVNEIITYKFDILGRGASYSNAAIADSTYSDVSTEAPMTATDFAGFVLGDISITCVNMLSMEINNNLRVQECLGSLYPTGVGYGDFNCSGKMSFFLEHTHLDVLQAFENNTSDSLTWRFGLVDGKKTVFTVPKFKISNLKVQAASANNDVMVEADWTGLKDSGISGTLKIERKVDESPPE